MAAPRVPERHKKPGILYATTDDGLELAVVDVTNPAFAVSLEPAEQAALTERFVSEDRQLERMPAILRKLLLGFVLRGSLLARGIRKAEGTFLPGLETYLLKLGPENLPTALIKPIDRRIAAALPALGVRLRLQDMAQLLVDAVTPALTAGPERPLRLLEIAGGPAMASLNALILLPRELLAGRDIAIDVLDLDEHGPSFGRRALAQLQSPGAPLHGLPIAMRHVRYDWRSAAELRPILREAMAEGAILAAISEGALFEYGSDEEIVANLEELQGVPVVGSVTRADEPVRRMMRTSGAALVPRGIDAFRALAARAGREMTRVLERPFSDHVALR